MLEVVWISSCGSSGSPHIGIRSHPFDDGLTDRGSQLSKKVEHTFVGPFAALWPAHLQCALAELGVKKGWEMVWKWNIGDWSSAG